MFNSKEVERAIKFGLLQPPYTINAYLVPHLPQEEEVAMTTKGRGFWAGFNEPSLTFLVEYCKTDQNGDVDVIRQIEGEVKIVSREVRERTEQALITLGNRLVTEEVVEGRFALAWATLEGKNIDYDEVNLFWVTAFKIGKNRTPIPTGVNRYMQPIYTGVDLKGVEYETPPGFRTKINRWVRMVKSKFIATC